LLLIGVILGFVPILQGWIFVLAGLSVIAPESRRVRRLLARLRAYRQRRDSAQSPAESAAAADTATEENRP